VASASPGNAFGVSRAAAVVPDAPGLEDARPKPPRRAARRPARTRATPTCVRARLVARSHTPDRIRGLPQTCVMARSVARSHTPYRHVYTHHTGVCLRPASWQDWWHIHTRHTVARSHTPYRGTFTHAIPWHVHTHQTGTFTHDRPRSHTPDRPVERTGKRCVDGVFPKRDDLDEVASDSTNTREPKAPSVRKIKPIER
jgi:hypothetical protein